MAKIISHQRLRDLLNYNPETGFFVWRVSGRGRFMREGARAGTLTTSGYRQISIDQRIYTAGPLAVLWMTGSWPKAIVDHINMDRDDNRWSNLREATYSQNGANSLGQKQRQSPFKGVTWSKCDQLYRATIKIDRRLINLGRFDTAEAAHAAYLAAAQKYFGPFARG